MNNHIYKWLHANHRDVATAILKERKELGDYFAGRNPKNPVDMNKGLMFTNLGGFDNAYLVPKDRLSSLFNRVVTPEVSMQFTSENILNWNTKKRTMNGVSMIEVNTMLGKRMGIYNLKDGCLK
jgi:hypothetical protein